MKQIIHVNQHTIRKNLKTGARDPVLTCKTYKSNQYAHEVEITHQGEVVARVVYSPDKPLSCGARVWIETDSSIVDVNLKTHEVDT